jgi:hypothetical protein
MDNLDEMDAMRGRPTRGRRLMASLRGGAKASCMTVFFSAGGSSVSASFAWPGDVWSGLATPRGRADLLFAVETALEADRGGWIASLGDVPKPGDPVGTCSVKLAPVEGRGDESRVRWARSGTGGSEGGLGKVARILDEAAKSRSMRGVHSGLGSRNGPLGDFGEMDCFVSPAPGGIGDAPGSLSVDDFVQAMEAIACSLSMEAQCGPAPSGSTPRI